MVWAILGTFAAAYYYAQYSTYRSEYSDLARRLDSVSLRVNLLISYGNGTTLWHNSTLLPLNATAFTALDATVPDLEYMDYGGDLGILITAINGVAGNSTHGWFYWLGSAERSMEVARIFSGETDTS
jgi:hypothetical protein